MAFKDIFLSKEQREKQQRMQRRKALRNAERAIDKVSGRVVDMKKECDATWREARDYLKAGQNEPSQRCLQSYRANTVLMSQLEKKHWVSRQLLLKMETAGIDQDIAKAFGVLQEVIAVDPEKIREALDGAGDVLEDRIDIEKMWEEMYEKDMAGVELIADAIPSVEELMVNLTDEAQAEVGGYEVAEDAAIDQSISEQIGRGRERLHKLTEDDR